MQKLVIGLVGEIGSGKGTVVDVFEELFPDKKIVTIKFSDVLADLLKILHMPKTRDNLQRMAIAIDEMFGAGTFNYAVRKRIESIDADIVFADGVRWPADEKMIREMNGSMVYVTAGQKTRYHRILARKEKEGEGQTTFEEFQKQDTMKNETFIADIGSRADYRIVNEGTLEDMKREVKLLAQKFFS